MNEQNVVILGANGGIGGETARRLRSLGAQVLLAGRNREALAELSRSIDSPYEVVDATEIDQVERCVELATERFGQVNGIVNCVGSVILKPAHLTTAAEWKDSIATNLTSAFATVRAGYQALRKNGGSIVLISTAAARLGLANHEAIAASKAGVIGLMQSAAATYAARQIRINAVAPGLVKTTLTERIWTNEKSAEFSTKMHALRRLGEPGDVASMIVWLLNPENAWVTGQVFGIDGGLGTLRSVEA